MSAEHRLRQLEAEVRVLLAEIGRHVGEPPLPDEYVSNVNGSGHAREPGWTWRPVDGWSVHVISEGPDRNAVYIHTPSCSFPSDVTPEWPEGARAIAAALLAAADAVDAQHKFPALLKLPSRPNPRELGGTH